MTRDLSGQAAVTDMAADKKGLPRSSRAVSRALTLAALAATALLLSTRAAQAWRN